MNDTNAPVAARHIMNMPMVRIDTDQGPLDVSFPTGFCVNVNTPSGSLGHPELQFHQRGVAYILNVTVWADEDGTFPVPIEKPAYVEGKRHINITRATYGKNESVSDSAYKALVRSAMAAVTLVLAREPFIRVRAEQARLNNSILRTDKIRQDKLREADLLADIIAAEQVTEQTILEQLLGEALKPTQLLEPGDTIIPATAPPKLPACGHINHA